MFIFLRVYWIRLFSLAAHLIDLAIDIGDNIVSVGSALKWYYDQIFTPWFFEHIM